MLIHSVTPAHLLTPQAEIPGHSYKQVGQNVLEGMDTPEGFQLSRIHSTDPALFLNKAFSPGSIYKG